MTIFKLIHNFINSLFSSNALFAVINADTAYPWMLGFQDGSTPTQEGIVELHNTIMFFSAPQGCITAGKYPIPAHNQPYLN